MATASPPRRAAKHKPLAIGIVSTAALVLLPKCPACFAGYFAIAVGVTLSTTMATMLQTGCVVALSVAIGLSVRSIVRRLRADR